MSPVDFTRWNRAGLYAIRYVDANAATHLDDLRAEFATCFPQWTLPPGPAFAETDDAWIERLLQSYLAARRDWGWETSRTFARALHMLAEHVDAYANESFLRTATQWDHVRRLTAMIGYTPKPAASAETTLVLVANTAGLVEPGFQVKHMPPDGTPPVIFETIDPIAIDPALNAVRLAGWDRNNTPFQTIFETLANGAGTFWVAEPPAVLAQGDIGLVVDTRSGSAVAVRLREHEAATGCFSLTPFDDTWEKANRPTVCDVHLLADAAKSAVPVLNGSDVIGLEPNHGCTRGDIVVWMQEDGDSRFARVVEADELAIRIETGNSRDFPLAGKDVFRARKVVRTQFTAGGNRWRLPGIPRQTSVVFAAAPAGGETALGLNLSAEANAAPPTGALDATGGFFALRAQVVGDASEIWFYDPLADRSVKTRAAPSADTLLFASKPTALVVGDWVVVSGNDFAEAMRVRDVTASRDWTAIAFDRILNDEAVRRMDLAFKLALRPRGWNRDPRTVSSSSLAIEGRALPDLLRAGRKLALESDTGTPEAIPALVTGTDPGAVTVTIDANADVLSTLTRGALVIRGNAVRAGHGEGKPAKALGSGNAEANNQEFLLDINDISHLRDAALPGGMRAALTVTAAGQTFQQVGSLRDSGPAEPHFTVEVQGHGTLRLRFGNGRQGRRLPTGANNILVRFRRGAGLSGNLAPFSLNTIAAPHPAIDDVRQPLKASGGDTREMMEQISSNAPARLVAMDRAISIKDYERLAAGYGGVWHAVAIEEQNPGRFRQRARVVVVPAGGGALGSLGVDLTTYLTANGLPRTDVVVENHVASVIAADITVRVIAAQHDPQAVADGVAAAVARILDLRVRRPGQTLYRSEIIRVVERVDGVVNSDVVLFPGLNQAGEAAWRKVNRGVDGGIWAVVPFDGQVIYEMDPAQITINTRQASI